ncbi:MAG: tail fiber domain-containing protein [Pyrinomonadaceae bacterium]
MNIRPLASLVLMSVLVVSTAMAQTTAFSHQGQLNNGGNPANGNYDFEFKLFDSVSGGTQIGSTAQRLNVAVSSGIFSVSLDFGAAALPGASRFLDIAVRTAGGGAFTQLSPRQPVTSAPYAIRSLNATTADTATNATQLGGVAANQYVTTATGGANFIQNQQAVAQSSTNFWISGRGSANILNAGEFQISGNRVLSNAGTDNLFAGDGAGQSNTTGGRNAFFGSGAGFSNTTGGSNEFFGRQAGFSNTTGNSNAFFGRQAGFFNTTGGSNTFFGSGAGQSNTTGSRNAFFGLGAGISNTTGSSNAFFGDSAGRANSTGGGNTIIGVEASVGVDNLINATAIGSRSLVTQGNSLVLGSINGVNGAMADTNVGIGTTAPNHRLTVGPMETPVVTSAVAGVYKAGATYSIVRDTANDVEGLFGAEVSGVLYGSMTNHRVALRTNNTDRITIAPTGEVAVITLGSAGAVSLCRNASNEISTCSSSLKYKTNIGQFSQGLSFVNKLRPVSFDWKDGGMRDVGFGAEDVAKIDPRFVTYNDKGEVEGVKYDRLSVVFVNAFIEQQQKIEAQQKQLETQQAMIERLAQRLARLENKKGAKRK